MTLTYEQSVRAELPPAVTSKSCTRIVISNITKHPPPKKKIQISCEILFMCVYLFIEISIFCDKSFFRCLCPILLLIKHSTVICFSLLSCRASARVCIKGKPSQITVPKPRERERPCRSFLRAPISSGQGERGHVSTVLKETIMMLSFQCRQWGGWSSELTVHKILKISSLPAQYVSD